MRRFVAVSLALHLLAVAGLLAWWRSRPARDAETVATAPIELSLVEVDRPAPVPPAPASAPPSPPPPVAKPSPPPPEPEPATPALEAPAPPEPAAEPTTEAAPFAEPAPPAAPRVPSPPPPARPSSEELARVRARIEAALRYPTRARRRGWEGTAVVRFHVEDGRATAVELVTPTGHGPLDREAVEVLERAAPYPPVPGTLEIPVTFQLR